MADKIEYIQSKGYEVEDYTIQASSMDMNDYLKFLAMMNTEPYFNKVVYIKRTENTMHIFNYLGIDDSPNSADIVFYNKDNFVFDDLLTLDEFMRASIDKFLDNTFCCVTCDNNYNLVERKIYCKNCNQIITIMFICDDCTKNYDSLEKIFFMTKCTNCE
jgi:hypothetical protein